MITQITCPECNHKFDVKNALSHDIENRIKKEYQDKLGEIKSSITERENKIELEKEWFQKLELNQKKAVEKLASKKLEEQSKLHKAKLAEDSKAANEKMAKTVKQQKDELLQARKEKLDFQEKLDKLKEREEQLELEVKEKMLKEKNKIKEEVQKTEQQKHYLELKQRDELVNGLKEQLNTMKRQWKEREKQLDIIIDGATDMCGSIKGIAGNAIQRIQVLELDNEILELDNNKS
jgi:chromosome segregation ATPase